MKLTKRMNEIEEELRVQSYLSGGKETERTKSLTEEYQRLMKEQEKKEKQIEEKKKIISDICPFYKEYGTCEQCNTELDIDDAPCYWECMANAIVNNGYRKASEVAEEIFGEIERVVNYALCVDITEWEAFAELKKKYTEEGK